MYPKKIFRIVAPLLWLCILLLLSSILWAANNQVLGSHQQPTPVQATAPNSNLEGVVEVSFRITDDGRVEIVRINATNPGLIDYVVKKLNHIQLEKNPGQSGQIIKYRFVFKKQA